MGKGEGRGHAIRFRGGAVGAKGVNDIGGCHGRLGGGGGGRLFSGVVECSALFVLMRALATELACSSGVSGLELPVSGIVKLVPFPVAVSVSARLSAPFDMSGFGLNLASSGVSSLYDVRLGSTRREFPNDAKIPSAKIASSSEI